jgi:enoyl-[acyl-carrier-protein] reductase (NADH)
MNMSCPAPLSALDTLVNKLWPASDNTRALVCLVEGDQAVFEVQADINQKIHHLKDLVHQKAFNDASLSKDLILLKVTISKSAV